jgi:toxin ParE1/3/4
VTRLVVSRDAEKDLATILAYLKDEANAIVAEEFGHDLRRTLLRLLQFPESGALRPELGPHMRLAIVYPYLLLYDHAASQVELTLLRILHGKSNITAEILMRR